MPARMMLRQVFAASPSVSAPNWAAIWRPFQTQNFVFRLSGAVLFPGQGFNDLFAAQGSRDFYYSVLANLVLTY